MPHPLNKLMCAVLALSTTSFKHQHIRTLKTSITFNFDVNIIARIWTKYVIDFFPIVYQSYLFMFPYL